MRLEPFDAERHADGLWSAFGGLALNERIRWFGWPALQDPQSLTQMLEGFARQEGWSTAVMLTAGRPVGMASYMREDATNGVVEIGAVAHSDALARTVAATEAHYLLLCHAFALGYRRYEWKSDDANEASKRAAHRLGFTYEGTFRQHQVKHGRNRDTAWFSILDGEWPAQRNRFETWLDPANFDEAGRQLSSLSEV